MNNFHARKGNRIVNHICQAELNCLMSWNYRIFLINSFESSGLKACETFNKKQAINGIKYTATHSHWANWLTRTRELQLVWILKNKSIYDKVKSFIKLKWAHGHNKCHPICDFQSVRKLCVCVCVCAIFHVQIKLTNKLKRRFGAQV